MPYKLLSVAAVAAVALGAAYMAHGKQPAAKTAAVPDFKVAKAEVMPVARTVRLTGQTSSRHFATIVAPMLRGPESRGLVLIQLVKPGSLVHKGQEVAVIDAQSTIDHIDDIKDTVKQAEADVSKRKAEQAIEEETLRQTLRQAKSDWEKAQLDAKPARILTPIERQLLELNVQQTGARYRELQKSVAEKEASFAAEFRILEITVERHKRHLGRHEHDLLAFTVKAPMDGLTVMQTIWRGGDMGQVEQGDQLSPGQPFMKIVDTKSMQVEATANQVETSDLRIGQAVMVRFDAFPGLAIPGTVYSIGALATGSWLQSYYLRSIPVKITLNGYDARVIPDLSASAEVTLEKSESAVAIPVSALFTQDGREMVRVREGGQFVERPVKLGVRNESQAAVISGLKAGEEVRVN